MQHERTFHLTGDTLTLYLAEDSSAPAATTAESLAFHAGTKLFLRLSLPEEQFPPELTGTHKGFPRSAVLTSAFLTFRQSGAGDYDAASRLLLYRATEENGTPTLPTDPILLDFEWAASTPDTEYIFDVTPDLRAAQIAETPAILALCVSGSGTFSLGGITHETLAPTLDLTYEMSYGEHTFGKTHVHTPTPYMTATHDLFRGNLLLSNEDFTGAGNRMPVSIRHCYNSAMYDRMFTKNHGVDTAHFSPMRLGLGWRLNLFESVMLIDGNYVYTDASGSEHFLAYMKGALYTTEDADMTYDPEYRTLTSDSEVRTFDSRGRLVEIADGENRMNIRYATAEDACETLRADQIMSVTDGAGRVYTFEYTPWYLAAITAPDGKRQEFFYTGDHLVQINHPDGCKSILTYEAESGFIGSVSYRKKNGEDLRHFVYGNENFRISDVIERFGAPGGGYYEGSRAQYTYSPVENRLIVSSNDSYGTEAERQIVEATYYFGADGAIVSEYMTLPNGERRGIKSEDISENAKASASSVNLLKDSDPSSSTHWILTAPVSERTSGVDINVYGRNFSILRAVNYTESGLWQATEELAAGEYNFSAFVRVFSRFLHSDGKGAEGFLRVYDSGHRILAESEHIAVKGDNFTRLDIPFFLETAQSVTVELCHHGCGQTDWAVAQLSPHAYPSPYNMLGSSTAEWICSENASVTNDAEKSFYGKSALCITSDKIGFGKAYKSIPVLTVDSVRESFTLSGWAKAPTYPEAMEPSGNSRVFCLEAQIVYKKKKNESEPEIEHYEIPFDSCISGWQHVSLSFAKTKRKAVEELRVFCCYGYCPGSAYFDGICLVRDKLELGVSSEEFARPTYGNDPESDESAIRVSTADAEVIPFEEAKDAYGNSLTETGFVDGALGTLYRALGYNETGNDPVCRIDTRGNATRYRVNEATSHNEAVIDRLGNMTAYRYDERGRTTWVGSYLGNSLDGTAGAPLAEIRYGYNELAAVTEIARGDGMGYELAYSEYHRLSRITVKGAEHPLVAYSYKNGSGPLKRIAYASGDYMDATYDSYGQLIGERWYRVSEGMAQEQARYRYIYDGNGNLVRNIDFCAQKEYTYKYESGRLTESAERGIEVTGDRVLSRTPLHTVAYTYDRDGNLTKKTVFPAENGSVTYHYVKQEDGNTILRIELPSQEKSTDVYSIAVNDSLGRRSFDELQLGKGLLHRRYEYCDGQLTDAHREHSKVKSIPTTQLVKTITFADGRTLSYEYDAEERITKVTDSLGSVTEYTYDALGQLLTETVNGALVNEMVYDGYGNIVEKNGKAYTYGDPVWRDLLTAYDGQSIVYDAGGNPTTYLGHTLTWEKGRQLKSFDGNTYTYNANGIRTGKTAGGVLHTYALDGTKLLRETWSENTLLPLYDNEDGVCGICYNGDAYFFVKNLQGDVIALADMNGETVARYTYDSWGKCLFVFDAEGNSITDATHIAQINPFRYRGYYYDTETGLYYLQSRYYAPTVGRFLNADELLATNAELCSYTLYSYCGNEPVARKDINGCAWWYILVAIAAVVTVAHIVNAAFSIRNAINSRTDETDLVHSQHAVDMPFGNSTIAEMGCGVVAVHNAMLLYGKSSRLSEVCRFMEAHDLTAGHCGAYFTSMQLYLRRKGIRSKVSLFGPKGKLDSTIKKSTSKIAILAYKLQGRMGHYITIKYEKNDEKPYCIYNCVEGQNGPHKEESIDRFVESDNKKILCLITLK